MKRLFVLVFRLAAIAIGLLSALTTLTGELVYSIIGVLLAYYIWQLTRLLSVGEQQRKATMLKTNQATIRAMRVAGVAILIGALLIQLT